MLRRRPGGAALLTILAVACLAPAAASAQTPRPAYATSVVGGTVATFDALTGAFGAPLTFGGNPWGVAITPDGATAYVVNEASDSVIPVDTATNAPGTPIPVGSSPRTIGIAPDGATAYVANLGSNTVTPIDLATRTADAPIAVGSGPHGIAIAPDGSHVYVANIFSGTVSVIDTATGTVVATIPGLSDPYTIAIAPSGATVYVTSLNGNDVTPIDTATEAAGTSIPVGAPTYGIAISPDGATAYVSQRDTGHVVPIDTATNTAGAPIAIGTGPEGLALTPDGRTAWVTDTWSGVDTVTPLDLASGRAGTPTHVGQAPMTIAIAPDRSPTAAFAASTAGLSARLDASASSDPDGTVASYAWDFGDGQSATTSQPTVSHTYAAPGAYTVALTVTDDEGCSQALVYTGQTASCSGLAGARATHTVTVAAPPTGTAPTPPAGSTPSPPPVTRQAIERFELDHRCVRVGHDGTARIGLRLRLALPGSVQVQVYRALARFNASVCPAPNPRARYRGKLRRVATLQSVTPAVVAASVQTRLTRSFELPPGLYRIGVRARLRGGELTRPAYRWVRVYRFGGSVRA